MRPQVTAGLDIARSAHRVRKKDQATTSHLAGQKNSVQRAENSPLLSIGAFNWPAWLAGQPVSGDIWPAGHYSCSIRYFFSFLS